MARPKGLPKTGGRKKGTPNKGTQQFAEVLESSNFSIAENAIKLFQDTENEILKLKLLEFLASYRFPKVAPKEAEAPTQEDQPDPYEGMTDDQVKAAIESSKPDEH